MFFKNRKYIPGVADRPAATCGKCGGENQQSEDV
jgi:hypothetical protein